MGKNHDTKESILHCINMSSSESQSSLDDEWALESDDEEAAVFAVCQAALSTSEFFQPVEFRDQNYVDRSRGATNQLGHLLQMPSLFRTLTGFNVPEWEELCSLVCPTIDAHARSTGELRGACGRPLKLDTAQRLLNCILYLKHDNTVVFDSSHWNWAKSSLCDDALFTASCVNAALVDEICWPSVEERRVLGSQIPEFPGCIGIIDGTLCRIRRPWADPDHRRWFNGRKKMYSVNNTVVVDHDGLFIYIDPGYPGSFHDVNALRHSSLMNNWRDHFTHTDDYYEFLLGDPGYVGYDQFIMRRMSTHEISISSNPTVIVAFNKMHAGYRVEVEWGIGGVKNKWRRLMKQFDNTKGKFTVYFRCACLLTNFLQRRRKNMHVVDTSEVDSDPNHHGWRGDY